METSETTGFHFDAAKHRYTLDGRDMTGCTTILGVIAKPALIQWAANEAVKYAKEHISERFTAVGAALYYKQAIGIAEIVLDEAKTAHAKKRDKAADQGTDTHAEVEAYVKLSITQFGGGAATGVVYPSSIAPFVNWALANNVRFVSSEQQFYSRSLFVAGTCDLIFEMAGKRYLADIKTFKKLWDRTPFFQMAGYGLMAVEMGEKPFDGYVVLNLPKEGGFEDYWSYDVEGDTEGFLAAVKLYRAIKNFSY